MYKAKESYSMWDGMDLRNWRDDLRMTQVTLARALGVSHRMYCYYESGERDIPKSVELSLRYIKKIVRRMNFFGRRVILTDPPSIKWQS